MLWRSWETNTVPKEKVFYWSQAESVMESRAMTTAGQSLAESIKSLCCCHVRVGCVSENALAKMTFVGLLIESE